MISTVQKNSASLLLSLRDYFDMIDADGKGEVDANELQCAITAMGEVQI
jgi:Ca2+-binding EF-hand superfamily protein